MRVVILLLLFCNILSAQRNNSMNSNVLHLGLGITHSIDHIPFQAISNYGVCVPFQYFISSGFSIGANGGMSIGNTRYISPDGTKYNMDIRSYNFNIAPTCRYYFGLKKSSSFKFFLISGLGIDYLITSYHSNYSFTRTNTEWLFSGNIGVGSYYKLGNRFNVFADVNLKSYLNLSMATSKYADHYENDFWNISLPVTIGFNYQLK